MNCRKADELIYVGPGKTVEILKTTEKGKLLGVLVTCSGGDADVLIEMGLPSPVYVLLPQEGSTDVSRFFEFLEIEAKVGMVVTSGSDTKAYIFLCDRRKAD